MIMALDCETTGVDLWSGAKPFLVTTCNDKNEVTYYEWNVEPLTREPIVPEEDITGIQQLINNAEEIILHNAKFDIRALQTIIPDLQWDWKKTQDTLVASHVLESNKPKDLTKLASRYLETNIKKYEDKIEKTVKEATRYVKKFFSHWRIAKRNLPEMPSAKQKVWKFDMWLPKAVATKLGYLPSHYFHTDLASYANKDSECTYAIWQIMKYQLQKRGLWKHYLFQMKTLRIATNMESTGFTFSQERRDALAKKHVKRSKALNRVCVSVAEKLGYDIEMPKKGINDSLRNFFINGLKLPPVFNKKGRQTFDKKEAMPLYLRTLPQEGLAYKFIETHIKKSNYDASISYTRDYVRYGKRQDDDTFVLHPNLNSVGTKTLRWSSKNPNSMNLSTQKDEDGNTLRYMFGPKEGREWWSFDARNIERRIPDYESGEQSLIDLYEKSDEPPFYGSYHIMIFSIIYEELWHDALKKAGPTGAKAYVIEVYKQQYKCTKNFNFAVQYGSGESNADLTARRPGAFKLTSQRLSKLNTLNQKHIAHARKYGYVEVLPHKEMDETKGYPLLCTLTESGSVLTTVPLSYHIQGSAMLLTCVGMHKVDEQLDEWRKGWDAFITMQVHDQIILDCPRRANPKENPRQSNLGRMRVIQRLLESGGQGFIPSIPTPFDCSYHPDNLNVEISF